MPKSRVDYATDQITVYRYCPYACRYCYVWRSKLFASRVQRGKYDPVEEAKKYLNKTSRIIVVSFVSDPYPPDERQEKKTREVLKVLSETKNKIMVLSKNPLLALRDVDVFEKGNIWLGTTIITLDDNQARYWEPNAPPPLLRLQALQVAKRIGLKTWLSIEPIIPHTTIPEEIVAQTLEYIDFYVLGAFNYTKQLKYTSYTEEILRKWYEQHVPYTIDILERNKKEYHIKRELLKYLDK